MPPFVLRFRRITPPTVGEYAPLPQLEAIPAFPPNSIENSSGAETSQELSVEVLSPNPANSFRLVSNKPCVSAFTINKFCAMSATFVFFGVRLRRVDFLN